MIGTVTAAGPDRLLPPPVHISLACARRPHELRDNQGFVRLDPVAAVFLGLVEHGIRTFDDLVDIRSRQTGGDTDAHCDWNLRTIGGKRRRFECDAHALAAMQASASLPEMMATNSSPPSRPIMSSARIVFRAVLENISKTTSPILWPKRSLMDLNLSRSKASTLTGASFLRRLAVINIAAAPKKPRR